MSTSTFPPATRDRLARVLHTLRMRGTFYCDSTLTEPWALTMPVLPDAISFHVITAGTCWLRVDDAEPVELRAGDMALVTRGLGHDLLSAPDAAPRERVEELPQEYRTPHYSVLNHGGGGRATKLICGIVSFDEPTARELVASLPPVIHLRGDGMAVAPALRDTLRLMADELAHARPGGEAVATRLADILVVQAIRAWLDREPDARDGWLRALDDERIGTVLEEIHRDPGHDWNLTSLARTAAMSRSAFSARFTELVGEAPISYLTRWRMNLAQMRLTEGDASIAEVASDVGYGSEAAFNRAFARTIGRTPGAVRRQARRSGQIMSE